MNLHDISTEDDDEAIFLIACKDFNIKEENYCCQLVVYYNFTDWETRNEGVVKWKKNIRRAEMNHKEISSRMFNVY